MKLAELKIKGFFKDDVGQITEVYTFEEIMNYPNISEREKNDLLEFCDFIEENPYEEFFSIVGYAKSCNYTVENPRFVQVYNGEVNFIDKLGGYINENSNVTLR